MAATANILAKWICQETSKKLAGLAPHPETPQAHNQAGGNGWNAERRFAAQVEMEHKQGRRLFS